MERILRCQNVSRFSVKFTAAFALVTLFHTLLVLNWRGLLFPNYLTTFRAVKPSSEELNYNDERENHEFKDNFDDEQRIISPDHFRLPRKKEEEGERGDAMIEEELSSRNISQHHLQSQLDTFSPKRTYSPLGHIEISSVKRFVFFVGYSRSGHSIVASLLDAHPEVIIAHEYNLFRKWRNHKYHNRSFLYNELYKNSYNNAEKGWRSSVKDQKGYTLAMKDMWQGSFKQLSVIGEKSGAVTAQMFDNDPLMFQQMLRELKDTVQVPVRVIHVVRNPYDMISTRLLYVDGESKKYKVPASVYRKHQSPLMLGQQVNRTIHIVQNVQELLLSSNFTTLEVHLADLVRYPQHVMNNLCLFIGVPCSQDYLKKCSDKVYNKLSRTRALVDWPQSLVDKVYEMIIKPYQPFWRYSFKSS